MKKLLLFSLSLSILCFTAYAGYYVWKKDKAKAERIEKKEKAREEKRERLNKYYELELKYALITTLNPKTNPEYASLTWDKIDEIKKQMFQDGYDWAEIDDLYIQAINKATEYVEKYCTSKK